MGRVRRSRTHKAHKGGVGTRKQYATKHYGRDFDQIVEDMKDPARVAALTEFDEDRSGLFFHASLSHHKHHHDMRVKIPKTEQAADSFTAWSAASTF